MMRGLLWRLLLLLATAVAKNDNNNNNNNQVQDGCDDDTSLPYSTSLASLADNEFYKICADTNKAICGDGTRYGFYITKPAAKHKNHRHKVLIEFMGGGACWNVDTCEQNSYYLTYPSRMDRFVGRSCTELQTQASQNEITMLCSQTLGTTDFREYTTIVVPYCTQDVHQGNAFDVEYEDGSVINHCGSHNVDAVLDYLYKNIRNPSHIVLTGCSAGGTALPVAYGLLHQHYNGWMGSRTQLSVLADSAVFLTPSYFLENAFALWQPWRFDERLGFNWNKYALDTNYPTELWTYIMRKHGNPRDQWGFVSHTADWVSIAYYEWMSGYHENNDDDDRRQLQTTPRLARGSSFVVDVMGLPRRLEDGNDYEQEWWEELTTAIESVENDYPNTHTYWMEGDNHCSFGLYYPLLEDGFDDWAGAIVKERSPRLNLGVSGTFLLALALGSGLMWMTMRQGRKKDSPRNDGFVKMDDDQSGTAVSRSRLWTTQRLEGLSSWPMTAGYLFIITVHCAITFVRARFAHPFENPSLGPTALGLSKYGILNPSMIVYKYQILRILSSACLCSGVLTYLLAAMSLFWVIRPLEQRVPRGHFAIVLGLLMIVPSAIYSWSIDGGATCAANTVILGLWMVDAIWRKQAGRNVCCLGTGIVFFSILLSVLFPFNSWILIVATLVTSVVIGTLLIKASGDEREPNLETPTVGVSGTQYAMNKMGVLSLAALALVAWLALMVVRKPAQLYAEHPYYTGCDLKYADDIYDYVKAYYGDERRLWTRQLGKDDKEDNDDGYANNFCAQFCVPHVASKGVHIGAQRFFDLTVKKGTCEQAGYTMFVVEKTFEYASYSQDVEIYSSTNVFDDDVNN